MTLRIYRRRYLSKCRKNSSKSRRSNARYQKFNTSKTIQRSKGFEKYAWIAILKGHRFPSKLKLKLLINSKVYKSMGTHLQISTCSLSLTRIFRTHRSMFRWIIKRQNQSVTELKLKSTMIRPMPYGEKWLTTNRQSKRWMKSSLKRRLLNKKQIS